MLEPYLILLGFVLRTPRGRGATAQAWRLLGVPPPSPGAAVDLFPGE